MALSIHYQSATLKMSVIGNRIVKFYFVELSAIGKKIRLVSLRWWPRHRKRHLLHGDLQRRKATHATYYTSFFQQKNLVFPAYKMINFFYSCFWFARDDLIKLVSLKCFVSINCHLKSKFILR